jgi:HK97 family phage portal protein
MGVISNFFNYIKGLMTGGEQEVTVTQEDIANWLDKKSWDNLSLYIFALNSGINVIANALSKCEIRTFYRGEEVRGDEYLLWNYSPNRNMNASEFMQKIVWNLIYKNECLVVPALNGDLLVADTYIRETYANFPDRFSGVNIDLENTTYAIDKTFRSDEVLFYRLNNKNLIILLNQVMDGYKSLLQAAVDASIKAAGERGVLKIDAKASQVNYGKKADGTPRTFNDVYREMMEKQFASYFKSANAVMPLWEGFEYETKSGAASKRSTSEVDDIKNLTSEIYGRVANALQIPPAILKGDIADVEVLTRNMVTFAIEPIAKMIERENNRKRNGREVLKGTYQMIDTSRIMHVDTIDIADKAFNLIGAGWSVDEVRIRAGDAPLNKEWSKQHYLSLNFAQYDKKGETDEAGAQTELSNGKA